MGYEKFKTAVQKKVLYFIFCVNVLSSGAGTRFSKVWQGEFCGIFVRKSNVTKI